MAEKTAEVLTNRCGFELDLGDVPLRWATEPPWEIEIDASAACCWRPVWESHDEIDRCIWHAEVDEKPINELRAARADHPECLDGAILRGVSTEKRKLFDDTPRNFKYDRTGEGELSFNRCSLIKAQFDGLSNRYAEFTGADLRQATFTDTDLPEADFTDTYLREAFFTDDCGLIRTDFTNASLMLAFFTDADLLDVDFTDASLLYSGFTDVELERAVFTDADLKEVDFTNAKLSKADFTDANLKKIDFTDADLSRANFTDVYLLDSDFIDADISDVDFTDTKFRSVDFTDADLQDADLSDADAREASFRHANLQNIMLTRADCRGTTFTNAYLYETVFADTQINSTTTFYDSPNSQPICIYEEDSSTVDRLPDDVQPLEAARWVYRRLETLHEANALSEEARQFHISKEEAERRLYRKWFLDGDYRTFGPWSVKTFMWYVTKHGESVARVFFWWAIVILTAGTLFSLSGGVKNTIGTHYAITSPAELGTIAGLKEFLWNMYFSVTTFSTVMDGGLAPVGPWTRVVVAGESLAGIVLTALFVFILGRRTAR